MNTKTKKNLHGSRRSVALYKERITNTTLSQIGLNVSRFLDQMNDPKVKDEHFRQIFTQTETSSNLYASNDELFISFCIEWKGGKP